MNSSASDSTVSVASVPWNGTIASSSTSAYAPSDTVKASVVATSPEPTDMSAEVDSPPSTAAPAMHSEPIATRIIVIASEEGAHEPAARRHDAWVLAAHDLEVVEQAQADPLLVVRARRGEQGEEAAEGGLNLAGRQLDIGRQECGVDVLRVLVGRCERRGGVHAAGPLEHLDAHQAQLRVRVRGRLRERCAVDALGAVEVAGLQGREGLGVGRGRLRGG